MDPPSPHRHDEFSRPISGEDSIDYEPLRIEVSKAGYEKLVIENFYVTAGNPSNIYASILRPKTYVEGLFATTLEQQEIEATTAEDEIACSLDEEIITAEIIE